MVVFILSIKADLEGVASVRFVPGSNLCLSVRNPLNDYEVREKVVIESDALLEEQPKEPSKHHPKSDHHRSDHSYHEPVCHFALKWEGATQRSTIQVILPPNANTNTTSSDGEEEQDDETAPTPAKRKSKNNKASRSNNSNSTVSERLSSDLTVSGEFVPMLALECHGVEPYAFHPMGGEFLVTNNVGVEYSPEQVDLSTGYWREFDMASGTTSITKFESKFV
jgi:hypothetical protein